MISVSVQCLYKQFDESTVGAYERGVMSHVGPAPHVCYNENCKSKLGFTENFLLLCPPAPREVNDAVSITINFVLKHHLKPFSRLDATSVLLVNGSNNQLLTTSFCYTYASVENVVLKNPFLFHHLKVSKPGCYYCHSGLNTLEST